MTRADLVCDACGAPVAHWGPYCKAQEPEPAEEPFEDEEEDEEEDTPEKEE